MDRCPDAWVCLCVSPAPQDTYLSLDDAGLVYFLALALLQLKRDTLLRSSAGEVGLHPPTLTHKAHPKHLPSALMQSRTLSDLVPVPVSVSWNVVCLQLPERISEIRIRTAEDIATLVPLALEVTPFPNRSHSHLENEGQNGCQ
jgi:hypothetical protein